MVIHKKTHMSKKSVKEEKDLSKYSLLFEPVFNKKDIKDGFLEHLKLEMNHENFLFLTDLEDIKESNIKNLNYILNTYIKENSKMELNISGKLKRMLLNDIRGYENMIDEEWKFEKTIHQLFEEIRKSIKNSLMNDPFPRFIRTDVGQSLYMKYIGDPDIMIPFLTLNYNYNDEDFYEKSLKEAVKEKDVSFILDMVHDSFDWNLVHSETNKKESMNIFVSKVNYLPKVSFFKDCNIVKFDYFLPLNFKDIFYQNTRDNQRDGFIMNTRCHDIDKITLKDNDFNIGRFEMDISLPFPLTTMRKYLFTSTTWYDKENETIYWVNKPFFEEKYQKKDLNEKIQFSNVITEKNGTKESVKNCLIYYSFQIFIFKKIDENRTNYQQIHITTFNGWSNIPFLKIPLLIERGKEIRKFTYEAIKDPISFDQIKNQKGLGKLSALLNFSK